MPDQLGDLIHTVESALREEGVDATVVSHGPSDYVSMQDGERQPPGVELTLHVERHD